MSSTSDGKIFDRVKHHAPDESRALVLTPLELLGKLAALSLDGLLEEFATREGTEYCTGDYRLDEKAEVPRALNDSEILIAFDTDSETRTLRLAREMPRRSE